VRRGGRRRHAYPGGAAARSSTVAALAGGARTPRRQAWLVRASAALPVPLLLALRLIGRRPRRAAERGQLHRHRHGGRRRAQLPRDSGADAILAGPFAGPPDPMRGRMSTVMLVVTSVMGTLRRG
jgi:hypothetical protein